MSDLLFELRHALRRLRDSPGFTAAVTLSMAVGIGLNAIVLTFVSHLFLSPLPIRSPAELFSVLTVFENGRTWPGVSYPNYLDFRREAQSFSSLAAQQTVVASLGTGSETRRTLVSLVTDNYFPMLGVDAAIGRVLEEEGRDPIVVISHDLWESRFFADPEVLGEHVLINNRRFEVVGVARDGFQGLALGFTPQMWVPLEARELLLSESAARVFGRRDLTAVSVVGYLADGVAFDSARAELRTIAANIEASDAQGHLGRSADLEPFQLLRGFPNASHAAGLFLALTGVVLLIGCGNVASLLLARGLAHRGETALRFALGATRSRIAFRELLDTFLLCVVSFAIGLPMVLLASRFLRLAQPPVPVTFSLELVPDAAVLGGLSFLVAVATLVAGLVPALRASVETPVAALRHASASIDSDLGPGIPLKLVVVFQVALCLVCLIATALFGKSLVAAHATEVGFDADDVVVASLLLPETPSGLRLVDELLVRIEAVPGVESATTATHIPFWDDFYLGFGTVSDASAERDGAPRVMKAFVGARYFETMRLPILAGRGITEADTAASPPVAVVSESLASSLWPDQDAVGRRIAFHGGVVRSLHRSSDERITYEVVGVARDARHISLGQRQTNLIYVPLRQEYGPNVSVHARFTPGQLAEPIRSLVNVVSNLDTEVPVFNVRFLADIAAQSLYLERSTTAFVALSASLALVLSVLGLYGVAGYAATRRTRELGIRMALGCTGSGALRLVLRESLSVVVFGVLGGIAAGLVFSRVVRAFLHEVSPQDPTTFVGASLMLTIVMVVTSLIPARRAARTNPAAVIRYE